MSSSQFDEIAAEYDEALPAHVVEHYLRKRVAFLARVCPGGAVLDVGCGTGALAAAMMKAGYTVSGADPSHGMLEVMRGRCPQAEVVQAPGSNLPFASGRFDLVVSVATMHHVAAPDEVRLTLGEMTRVCRPGGRIVIWDHNPRNPYWTNLMSRVPQDTGEERLIPEPELVSGLVSAGAQVLTVHHLGLVPDFTPRWALPLAAAAEWVVEHTPFVNRFTAHNVVVARPSGGG